MTFSYSVLASWIILIVAAIVRRDRRRSCDDVITLAAFMAFAVVGEFLLNLESRTRLLTYDAALLRADRALGINTLAVVSWGWAHHGIWVMLVLEYFSLAPVIAIAWVAEQSGLMRRAVLLGGLGSFIFYWMFPAVGPALFDWRHGVAAPGILRNCMPSMHFGWALLVATNARQRRLKLVWSGYAALMAFATIGLGQHYVIDLLAAVPYAALTQALARAMPQFPAPVARSDRQK